jgi:hypothetical protein
MRILCAYTKAYLKDETDRALSALAPYADFVNVTDDEFGYFKAIGQRWTGEHDLLIVEQDMLPTADALAGMESCPEGWCSCSYPCFLLTPGPHIGELTRGLGFTKFGAEFQRKYPFSDIASQCHWTSVDSIICSRFEFFGENPHDHGPMEHLHDYTQAMLKRPNFAYYVPPPLPYCEVSMPVEEGEDEDSVRIRQTWVAGRDAQLSRTVRSGS